MPQVQPSRLGYLCRYPNDLNERLDIKGMSMEAIDAKTHTTSSLKDWYDASILATEDQTLPSTRIDWLSQAMKIWVEDDETSTRTLPAVALNA